MTTAKKEKETEAGTIERLSKRGEETLTRLADELARNELVADALARASSARGRLDGASKRALGQVGLASTDELEALRKEVARLEKRLAKLEGAEKPRRKPAAKKPTSSRAKKTVEKTASPSTGRSVGGGVARG
jgi:polyhydroxyalkanoate synthesis regulator phasin